MCCKGSYLRDELTGRKSWKGTELATTVSLLAGSRATSNCQVGENDRIVRYFSIEHGPVAIAGEQDYSGRITDASLVIEVSLDVTAADDLAASLPDIAAELRGLLSEGDE
jgi:hypothetical protein